MKLIALALTFVAFALVISACTETATNSSTPRAAGSPAAPSPAASVDPFATTRATFAKNCEPCHGPTGEGGLAKVENKQIKVPSLHAEHAKKHTDEQLTKMITNGEEEMPSFKNKLKPEEIADLVRFVRKEFQGR